MREINYLVVHCSATRPSQDIGVLEITDWHVSGNGWSDVGYHFVIRRSGEVENGRPVESPGAHVKNYNSNSIGICLVGGLDDEMQPAANYTEPQWTALRKLLTRLKGSFPNAEVTGHRDFPNVTKACPCFDVEDWWRITEPHITKDNEIHALRTENEALRRRIAELEGKP